MYRLSKDAFKAAGKQLSRMPTSWESMPNYAKITLCYLIMRTEHSQIGVISMSTVIKRFQELTDDLVQENACPSDDDEW